LLLDSARDRALADARARALYPRLLALHRWWAGARDPHDTGLVAIYHPWESGRDNSPVWDEALQRVPPTVHPGQRRDTGLVDPGRLRPAVGPGGPSLSEPGPRRRPVRRAPQLRRLPAPLRSRPRRRHRRRPGHSARPPRPDRPVSRPERAARPSDLRAKALLA